MTTRQCGERFYNGAEKGKANSVFIEGQALYSYGHHFPMVVRLAPDVYAWNEDRYSVTTSKHQSQCYPYGKRIIPMDTNTAQTWAWWMNNTPSRPMRECRAYRETLEYCAKGVSEAVEKKGRARSESKRDYWQSEAERYQTAGHLLESLV